MISAAPFVSLFLFLLNVWAIPVPDVPKLLIVSYDAFRYENIRGNVKTKCIRFTKIIVTWKKELLLKYIKIKPDTDLIIIMWTAKIII